MRNVLWCLLTAALATAVEPPFQVVDIDTGTVERVRVGRKTVEVKLLSTSEDRDPVRSAIREARVEVAINGRRATLVCGNYRLPVNVGGVQADCAVTKAYYSNSNRDHWGLVKDARLRLWPAGSTYMPSGTFGYPVRQRWFATHTQMSNEPTYVDGGERFGSGRIYYHAGLDIGGAEGLVDVLAATGGVVVQLGKAVLAGHEDAPLDRRFNETIFVLDERGWYHRYTHLYSFDPSITLGQRVRMGQKIGTLGKEGTSGGWSHLHYEIIGKQPSGKWGTVEGYAFLWEAYRRQYQPEVVACARPHVVALTGQKVRLDGSRSWSRASKRMRYDWTFCDGGKASGAVVEHTYAQPGIYSEMLKVTDARGRTAWDFITVDVLDANHRDWFAPALHAAYWPTMDLKPAQAITFKVRTFGTTNGEEVWDFGDGTPQAATKSDGNVKPLAPDGYAATTHAFQKPGDYVVRVERANALGLKGIAHLHVHVSR
jgi:murein DD-endopeptidase MepM/ murein hydrolase activator NlpD